MVSARRRAPRSQTRSGGPSGFTVFLVFLVLSVVCVSGGFAVGKYLLATLGETIADGGGGSGDVAGPGGGGSGGDATDPGAGESGGGSGGDSGETGEDGGTVPAGGGSGSATCELNSLTFYAVQVGAFGARSNADAVVDGLASKGLPGFVIEPAAGVDLYKVWTAPATDGEVTDAVLALVRDKGYPDCFVTSRTVGAGTLTFQGSSVSYVEKVADAVETLVRCLRIEGDVWDDYYAGSLDRVEAGANVDAMITTLGQVTAALAGLEPPSDLEALGEAVAEQLTAAAANLEAVRKWLDDQVESDLLAAQSSYIGLLDEFHRFEAGLGS